MTPRNAPLTPEGHRRLIERCSAGVSRWHARCWQAGAPSPGSGTGLERGEVAHRITVMLSLFL
jgi:hypothetical protein